MSGTCFTFFVPDKRKCQTREFTQFTVHYALQDVSLVGPTARLSLILFESPLQSKTCLHNESPVPPLPQLDPTEPSCGSDLSTSGRI